MAGDQRSAGRQSHRDLGLALLRHRIAVIGGGGGRCLARDIEQDRRDRSAEGGADRNRRQHQQRGERVHREGERDQDRHRDRTAEPRQDADPEADHRPGDHEQELLEVQGGGQPEDEMIEHGAAQPARSASLSISQSPTTPCGSSTSSRYGTKTARTATVITAVTSSRRRFAYPISVGIEQHGRERGDDEAEQPEQQAECRRRQERGGIARPVGARGRIVPVDDDLGVAGAAAAHLIERHRERENNAGAADDEREQPRVERQAVAERDDGDEEQQQQRDERKLFAPVGSHARIDRHRGARNRN